MVDRWFKTLARVPSVALMSLCVMSACAVEKDPVVSITPAPTPAVSPSPSTQPSNGQIQQIAGCSALGGTRKYVVDQLIPRGNSFDIAIYQGSGDKYSDYIGTVQANRTQDGTYSTQTHNSKLEVFAFSGRTSDFTVKDSVSGEASGRCWVQWEMADSKTRQLVRQCLALIERKYGSPPEVARNGCIGNPSDYMAQEQLSSSTPN